ncbi:BTA121 domain-containing protein surface lipoprotein [Borrelia persica]|uniref:BTA121 domain-containing protein surface lipoprotein n=1 Tax=Borrelia persica TaxID=44448 RepID=UPI0004664F52|nr:hypothetical protein [Borrelia persica]
MVRGKYYVLFVFLVLMIGCNLKSTKNGETSREGSYNKRSFEERIGITNFDDDVVDDNLDSALNSLKISVELKRFILYLASIASDPNIIISDFDRAYTADEFYYFLKKMDKESVYKLVKFSPIYKKLSIVKDIIATINDSELKFVADSCFKYYVYVYSLSLKETFNMCIANQSNVHLDDKVNKHSFNFDNFAVVAEHIKVFDSFFEPLSNNQKKVFYYIFDVVSNIKREDVKFEPYHPCEFYALLGKLGVDEVRNILDVQFRIIDKIFEIEESISNIVGKNINLNEQSVSDKQEGESDKQEGESDKQEGESDKQEGESHAEVNIKIKDDLKRVIKEFADINASYDLYLSRIFYDQNMNKMYYSNMNNVLNFDYNYYDELVKLKFD